MAHPHEYLLQEYKISIDKLVPLTPSEVISEAEKLYGELSQDESASERQIRQALIHIGKKEFPYRKAYEELCAGDEERRLEAAALQKLDEPVKAKLKPLLENGVHLTDFANSKLFETNLESDERYRVEQAILEAHDVVGRECDDRAKERAESYETLVATWKKKQEDMQKMIDQLRSMAERNPESANEIIGKADQFEEGWSIVERDPSEEELKKEIENWAAVMEEHEAEGDSEVV